MRGAWGRYVFQPSRSFEQGEADLVRALLNGHLLSVRCQAQPDLVERPRQRVEKEASTFGGRSADDHATQAWRRGAEDALLVRLPGPKELHRCGHRGVWVFHQRHWGLWRRIDGSSPGLPLSLSLAGEFGDAVGKS